MPYARYDRRVDGNQREVIETLEAGGALVKVIAEPTDLLVGVRGTWIPTEVKKRRWKGPKTDQCIAVRKATGWQLPAGVVITNQQKEFLEQVVEHKLLFVILYDTGDAKRMVGSGNKLAELIQRTQAEVAEILEAIGRAGSSSDRHRSQT